MRWHNRISCFAQNAAEADVIDENVIIVTAQRTAERLQDVPIAISAFSAAALESQQIDNASDLQLTLPNVTFTKGNFTSSSFTIRGIGDLCVGSTCDSATAIHLDGTPLLATRFFETEYFDLERIEVLRGPQGTLFGRNATSGVVNIIPARPKLDRFEASVDAEYGNFDSIKGKGMVNVPIGDIAAVRLAGFYLKRDGYTKNLFDGQRLDDRDLYSVRGSLRIEPTDTTTIDLYASYYREDDNRLRIQKQQCQRDPTGVLGCLAGRRDFETSNANASLGSILTSREFLGVLGIPAAFALGSVYGTDGFASNVNPRDPRVVNTDYTPTYFSDEEQYQARIEQELGSFNLQLTGFYHKTRVDSTQDYFLSVFDRSGFVGGLNALAAAGAGAIPGLPATYFRPVAQALIPQGPKGPLCTSQPEFTQTGVYGGFGLCTATPQEFDRSNARTRDWSAEGILTSDFDGPFNFLLGGIYVDLKSSENSYFVDAFALDYSSGILGAFTALGNGLPPSYLGPPAYRNHSDNLALKSYGIFGEVYYDIGDRAQLTVGVRYNNDKKSVRARTSLLNFLVPFGTADAFASPFVGAFDADPGVDGNQLFQERRVKFDEFTGRAVFDYKLTDDNLLYASYSRGYKSGGINPPLSPIFTVPESFEPELIDAFEIGSKNSFGNGALTLNLTAFYYKYKALQLSRIVARTSVNDNVDADIYGVEAEAVVRPSPNFTVNMGFSYLQTKVTQDKLLVNPRDPGGGRADAVIIKDLTNASNCAVASNSGSVAGVNGFVNQVNALINAGAIPGLSAGAGLRPTTAFPANSGLASTGAFSVCGVLSALAGPVGSAFGGVTVESAGIPVNIKGNKLPQAPEYKFSVGAQYAIEMDNGWSLVPRADLVYTGETEGSIFNGFVNRFQGYAQANAQVQLNGPEDRWYARAFVQNIFDNDAVTGLYLTDASSANFTNIFTLEPRRFGLVAGVKF